MQTTAQKDSSGEQRSGGDTAPNLLPTLSLPKGGGAIRGMGEKFGANPVTGTGSFTIPIFTSPGRSGFYPKLSLAYDSGAGNGPFGLGWSLSVPSITRKTDKGLPRYEDAEESDVFILSEAEDLVPTLCRRVLMFHNFAELGDTPCLVRSTNLTYDERPLASYLVSAQLFGYIRKPSDQSYSLTDPKTNEVLSPKRMPSVDMIYTEAIVDQTVRDADPTALENLPYGVDGGHFQWVDLDSEGSPGVLAEYSGSWLYKRNASNVPRDGVGNIIADDDSTGSIRAYFEPVEEVATIPSIAQPIGSRQHFIDLDGERDGSSWCSLAALCQATTNTAMLDGGKPLSRSSSAQMLTGVTRTSVPLTWTATGFPTS